MRYSSGTRTIVVPLFIAPLPQIETGVYVGGMNKLVIVLLLASPILAIQLVNLILLALHKLYDLMAESFPSNAPIVQSAIDLTRDNSAAVAATLAAYAIIFWRVKSRDKAKAAGSA